MMPSYLTKIIQSLSSLYCSGRLFLLAACIALPQYGFTGTPVISTNKSRTVVSDPANGSTDPKSIPGAVIEYTLTVSNTGDDAPDANSILITEPLDANTLAFYVTDGVTFTDGATSSALAIGSVTYSQTAAPGPYVYDYTPTGPYDGNVTSIQITTTGTFAFGGAPSPSFLLKFKARIK